MKRVCSAPQTNTSRQRSTMEGRHHSPILFPSILYPLVCNMAYSYLPRSEEYPKMMRPGVDHGPTSQHCLRVVTQHFLLNQNWSHLNRTSSMNPRTARQIRRQVRQDLHHRRLGASLDQRLVLQAPMYVGCPLLIAYQNITPLCGRWAVPLERRKRRNYDVQRNLSKFSFNPSPMCDALSLATNLGLLVLHLVRPFRQCFINARCWRLRFNNG